MKEYVVIDVGGSAIKHAVMNENGDFLQNGSCPTPKEHINEFIETIGHIVDEYKKVHKIEGLAASMPCPVEPKTGLISGGSAVPCLHGPEDVQKLLEERTGLKVVMENDGNCAGLAEGFLGAAKGCANYVVMVIGSGIGGTIIINHSIVYGKNLHCGEFGCMIMGEPLREPMGVSFSTLGATYSLIQMVAHAKRIDANELTGIKIFEMAAEGDEIVEGILKNFYQYLAVGIFNLQYAIDPEKILIGGAISRNELLLEEVNKRLKVMKGPQHLLDIVAEPCYFKGEANLIGALYNFINKK